MWVWWLISCVSLTGPQVQIFGQILSWVPLQGCFWKTVTFKPVDWVKQMALSNVGGPHPISQCTEQTTKADSPWVRKNSSFLMTFRSELHQLHMLYWSYTVGSSGSQTFGHRQELNHWLSSVFSLQYNKSLALSLSLSLSLYIYIYIHTHTHTHTHTHIHTHNHKAYWFCFSGEL